MLSKMTKKELIDEVMTAKRNNLALIKELAEANAKGDVLEEENKTLQHEIEKRKIALSSSALENSNHAGWKDCAEMVIARCLNPKNFEREDTPF
jgi:regulator of replication initiation timing